MIANLSIENLNLTLTFDEARWLMEYMRNQKQRYPQDEPKYDKKMRAKFFKYLTLVEQIAK